MICICIGSSNICRQRYKFIYGLHLKVGSNQCDQKKIAKSLQKLPKNDFTRKIKDFDTFKKLPKNGGDWGKLIVAKGFTKLPKVQ